MADTMVLKRRQTSVNFPPWAQSVYRAGDSVRYGGNAYVCTEDNGDAAWTPGHWSALGGGGGSAEDTTYDNTESGLGADNVQDAVDLLASYINGVNDNAFESDTGVDDNGF